MVYRLALVVLLSLCCPQTALADDIRLFGRDFPKTVAVYGSFFIPPGVSERARDNAKFELYIKPSITLRKLTQKSDLVAYTIFGLLKDRAGFSYNNKVTFALGLEVRHKLSRAVSLAFGGKWETGYELSSGVRRSGFVLTADASLWKTWQPDWLQTRLPQGSKIILSGWANYRFPGSLDKSESNNGLLQGAVKFALSVPYRTTKLSLAPYFSFTAKADHAGRSYNNILEPALGLELSIPIKGGGSVAVGVKSSHQISHSAGTRKSGNAGYVSWYKKF
jgi:hypothetical protein